MVIHQYDKRKNNKTEGARAKLKEYIEKGKELKKAAEEEEEQEDELIFTIEDLKELDDEEEPKKEEPKKEEHKKEEAVKEVIKEIIKEEPKEDYKNKYETIQKEIEEMKKNPKILEKFIIKSQKEIDAELLRSKLIAMFQSPHK